MSQNNATQYQIFNNENNENKLIISTKNDNKYFKSLDPIKPTPVYDTYWRFAYSRQEIFFRRFENFQYPWTEDPILQNYKFTNAYRASDRVSQYLIKDVIYADNYKGIDTFFRIILFKTFNKIETWQLLEKAFGQITYEDYNFEKYNNILNDELSNNHSIYSAAYIMPSAKIDKTLKRKHSNHLKLIEWMMNDQVPHKIMRAKKMQNVYDILIDYPLIGNFLAYQYTIDLNYSNLINFSENQFVVPGPGALSGISKCFYDTGGLTPTEIIKFMFDRQEIEFERLGLQFRSLWGRPLMLIDCQNLFCEVDKYSRIAHPEFVGKVPRKKIKQKYKYNSKGTINYWYPPKWGLNEFIK